MSSLADRLDDAARTHRVPGASLAVLKDGELETATSGVLNIETGVAVTAESVFQIGSTAKVYTATAVLRLVEQGSLDLDRPVVDVLPEFRVADADVTERVTPRHLLTHTSGIAGDFFEDTGRGDDAVARLVALCAGLGQDVPLGSVFSYSNTGFIILGRLIEHMTGQVWETALRELVLEPMGLQETVTSAEEATRFRWAYGHVGDPPGLAPVWSLPRSAAPAGTTMLASAPDLVRFGAVFLNDGRTIDGKRVFDESLVRHMLEPQAEVPDRWSSGDHRGLGWMLHDRGGKRVFGHGGATVGQRAFLEVTPRAGVVIALVANGGNSAEFGRQLVEELQQDLAGVAASPSPAPAETPGGQPTDVVGRYQRFGLQTDIAIEDGQLTGLDKPVEPLLSQIPDPSPVRFSIRPSTAGPHVYVARDEGATAWRPLVSFEVDGQRFIHIGGRAARRVSLPAHDTKEWA